MKIANLPFYIPTEYYDLLSSSINLAKDPEVKSIPTKSGLKLVTKSHTFKILLDSIDRFLSDYTSLSKVTIAGELNRLSKSFMLLAKEGEDMLTLSPGLCIDMVSGCQTHYEHFTPAARRKYFDYLHKFIQYPELNTTVVEVNEDGIRKMKKALKDKFH